VVVADGEITSDDGSGLPFGGGSAVTPRRMKKAFQSAAGRKDVAGIVFRVNSPGGLALASEEILHSARKAVEKKPLVVSMGNVAASGGFYISTAAQRLFAEPGSITGSIGIFGGKLDLSGLYDKLDLHKELYTRGRFAGMMSTIRPFTDEERNKYLSQLTAFYDHFVELVAENRSLTFDSVDALSQGKVGTGREAVANGLIDDTGGLKKALDYLADSLGLEDYAVELFPKRRILFPFGGNWLVRSVASLFAGKDGMVKDFTDGFDDFGLMARMPFDIVID
jgi:protease-4